MIFDIHSHIIPGVDDGASSMEESIEILRSLKKQGVDRVIATPHFYASEVSINQYVDTISAAFERLLEHTQGMDLPELICGSEVHCFRGMSRSEDLRKLCIHSSRYILLELPYRSLDEKLVQEINDIAINMELTPILAHIDRYLAFNRYEELLRLFRYGDIHGQINADALCHGLGRKKVLQFFEEDCCIYLGSDAHNMNNRPPKMDKALEYLQKKQGQRGIQKLYECSEQLYSELMKNPGREKYL
ncbi:MAG: hypothetical protein HFE39_05310 [Clostridiales bacterium]|jgi:protein-tyrosine phosphatase|nr:hypothetical protein [Clostridiales bacterium]